MSAGTLRLPKAIGWRKKMSQEVSISVQFWTRRATSTCRLRHDRTEQGPTEPQTGRGTFLLSSGGAGGGYY